MRRSKGPLDLLTSADPSRRVRSVANQGVRQLPPHDKNKEKRMPITKHEIPLLECDSNPSAVIIPTHEGLQLSVSMLS